MTGATINASDPIQVHLFTGNDQSGINYEARACTVPAGHDLSNDYLGPRSSDGDYWLYNGDPTTPLTWVNRHLEPACYLNSVCHPDSPWHRDSVCHHDSSAACCNPTFAPDYAYTTLGPTSAIPVALLPETGYQATPALEPWLSGFLIILGLLFLWYLFSYPSDQVKN